MYLLNRKAGYLLGAPLLGLGSTAVASRFANGSNAWHNDFIKRWEQRVDDYCGVARYYGNAAILFIRLSFLYKTFSIRSKHNSWRSETGKSLLEHETHRKGARIVLRFCEDNGGIFIKMGQFLSHFSGTVPAEYIQELEVLQDKAPKRPVESIMSVLDTELGSDWRSSIVTIDPEPVGCASLAQVHRGILSDGRIVAIKVQHEDLPQSIKCGIALVRTLDKLASWVFHKEGFSLASIVDDFEQNIQTEINFSEEAKNCMRCRENFQKFKRVNQAAENVIVPEIVETLSTNRVVTMDFVDGISIRDLDRIFTLGVSLEQVSKTLVEAFAMMIFVFGFVHADPHQGNLSIVIEDNINSYSFFNGLLTLDVKYPGKKAKLGLLDHGLYREFDQEFRKGNCLLWEAMLLRKDSSIQSACAKMGVENIWRMVPFILLNRAVESKATLGEPAYLSTTEAQALRESLGLSAVGASELAKLDELPTDMLFALKIWHILKSLNDRLSGNDRNRFLVYAKYALWGGNLEGDNFKNYSLINDLRWFEFLLKLNYKEMSMKSFLDYFARSKSISPEDTQTSKLTMTSILGESLGF